MRKLLLFFILIFSFNIITYAEVEVSERILVGLKYGSSAVSSQSITSDSSGFIIRSQGTESKPVANLNKKSVTVSPLTNNGIDPYIIIEQSGFPSYDDAVSYCDLGNNEAVPYYLNGVFYAIRCNLYTYSDALIELEKAKQKNITSYIMNPTTMRVKITDSSGNIILVFSEDNGEILGLCAKDDGTVSLGNSSTHRDIIEFLRNGNSLSIIANLTMQHYLYSVVAAEIGASAPIEAQKAQAVCARTYAQKNMKKHSSYGFDICATVHCQVYNGTKWERDLTIKAVDETKNKVATYNGKLIEAVYFSHSGGRTANVKDVWGSDFPYLSSVEDEYCTDSSWEYEIDYDKLTTKLSKYSLGTITDFQITETSPTGTVTKVTVTGTNGSKTLTRENIRIALGLNSQNFTQSSGELTKYAKTSSGDKNVNIKSILTKDGIKSAGNTVSIKDGNNNISTITALGGNVLHGKGIGHLVGFSQHGAMGYANAGWDYEKILKHYYQGIEISGI